MKKSLKESSAAVAYCHRIANKGAKINQAFTPYGTVGCTEASCGMPQDNFMFP
jgi:hypothetical protein